MSAPTPEAEVRRVCMALRLEVPEAVADDVQRRILAALRAARAAAIEEAARVAEEYGSERPHSSIGTAKEIAAAIRSLGEESAAPPDEATS